MLITRIPRSKRAVLKGATVRLLVGLMVFYLFTSFLTLPALADGPDGSAGWTECATEGANCSFTGTKDVRYWITDSPTANYGFISKVFTGGTACTIAAFGNDPEVGATKKCFYRDVQLDSGVTAVVSGLNNKVTVTFHTYAIQTGTLDELKSKIIAKKTGDPDYFALGTDDTVTNPTSTATSSTLVINFTETHWAKSAIATAAAAGIVAGYSDNSFGPDDFITREQMAASLHVEEGRIKC